MKIKEGQAVPAFKAKDVHGKEVTFQDEKFLLSFQRNAGCPFCNMQVHELLKHAGELEKQHIKVVLVYQSSKENLLEYLSQATIPFTFIADPGNTLYELFGVEKSLGKFLKGLVNGVIPKIIKGNKLYTKKIKMDGDATMIGADFIINKGIIKKARYGNYAGDHFSPDQILSLLN